MALILFDGCGKVFLPADMLKVGWTSQTNMGWTIVSNRFVIGNNHLVDQYFGGSYYSVSSGSALTKALSVASGAQVFIGFAHSIRNVLNRLPYTPGTKFDLLRVNAGASVQQLTFVVNGNTRKIEVYRGTNSGTLLGVTSKAITTTWAFYEFRVKIDGSAGEVEIRCEGETILLLTGINTAATAGTTAPNEIRIGFNNSPLTQLEQFYICDDSGAAPWNGFQGPAFRIYTPRPSADVLTTSWTSTLAQKWYAIADNSSNIVTNYVSSTTLNAKLTVELYNLPTALTLTLLTVRSFMYLADTLTTPTAKVTPSIEDLVPNSLAGAQAVAPGSTNYGVFHDNFANAPDGGAWTVTKINNLRMSFKVDAA